MTTMQTDKSNSEHLDGNSEHYGDSSEHYDICPRCGLAIDLTQPHGYDYGLDTPVHRVCEAEE